MNTVMRPAVAADRQQIAQVIYRRSAWLRRRGLLGWEQHAEALAAQAGTRTPMWVLEDPERQTILGATVADTRCPPWLFTAHELTEPSLFLASTVVDPRFAGQRLGCRIAGWALNHAADTGRWWVRRGAAHPRLVRYYTDVQGWKVVRTRSRRGQYVTALTRSVNPWSTSPPCT